MEPKKIKSVSVSIVSPSICHEVIGSDAMILVFWMLSFKPAFSLFSFTFIKRLFCFSSLSASRVVSSGYLRVFIFLLAILIPACDSSSPAFHMMYSAFKLNKQGDNIQPWRTSFPILNQSVVLCPVLTVVLWLAYRFLRRQVRWYGFPFSLRLSQFICDPHSQRVCVVPEVEVAVFFWNSLAFSIIQQMWAICLNTHTHTHTHTQAHAHIRGGGNGNPLQYSCLENPLDRGAWWATVQGAVKSWTRLRWLRVYIYIYIDTLNHFL